MICSKDFVLIMILVSLEYVDAELQVDLNRSSVYRYVQKSNDGTEPPSAPLGLHHSTVVDRAKEISHAKTQRGTFIQSNGLA